MKQLFLILTIALALASILCTSAFAQQPVANVVCLGTACGGPGGLLYMYTAAVQNGLLNRLDIAVSDLNLNNYRNFGMPMGWGVNLIVGGPYIMGPFNPHGAIHAGGVWASPGYLSFTGPPIPSGTFGFNNPNLPSDVDWFVGFAGGGGQLANWAMPIGMGLGPVHAP